MFEGDDGDRLEDATPVSDGLATGDALREELAWPVPGFSLPHAATTTAARSTSVNATPDRLLTIAPTQSCVRALSSAPVVGSGRHAYMGRPGIPTSMLTTPPSVKPLVSARFVT